MRKFGKQGGDKHMRLTAAQCLPRARQLIFSNFTCQYAPAFLFHYLGSGAVVHTGKALLTKPRGPNPTDVTAPFPMVPCSPSLVRLAQFAVNCHCIYCIPLVCARTCCTTQYKVIMR